MRNIASACVQSFIYLVLLLSVSAAFAADPGAPSPLLRKGQPVDWWFVFKFNAASFPACGGADRACIFDEKKKPFPYPKYGQQFVYASSEEPTLQKGSKCLGDTTTDPVGATFDQIYKGNYFYVLWNDQFYDHPVVAGGGTWGHSKGMVAWNSAGEGVVIQVTTPSWPAAGSSKTPRKDDANTLGCTENNNVLYHQHFFALKLSKDDLLVVLEGLANASVMTDTENVQIVRSGGPADVKEAVEKLGQKSPSKAFQKKTLSGGVQLISKPSNLQVPPWQMVSALLGGVSLRTATYWNAPKIPTTTKNSKMTCWDNSLDEPGAVEIATTGQWGDTILKLGGGGGNNHAKLGVSISGEKPYSIFGDMNQQGSIAATDRPCKSSQNGRGGLFYVVENAALTQELTKLMSGETASTEVP
jgi:hypothetical protein